MFTNMALAVGFTPRLEALLREASRLSQLWQSRLILVHAGSRVAEREKNLHDLMVKAGLSPNSVPVFWVDAPPARAIIRVCREQKVDLLIAGALKREKAIQYYLGTVARKLLRQAPCSVLVLTDPGISPSGFRNIVVQADEDNPNMIQTLQTACALASREQAAWLHVVKKVKWYTFLTASEEFSEEEYERKRNTLIEDEVSALRSIIQNFSHDHVKINIKLISGKAGHELAQFARRKQADLLIVSASPLKLSLLDRFLPNDLEYLFSELPCNLLMVHHRKGRSL